MCRFSSSQHLASLRHFFALFFKYVSRFFSAILQRDTKHARALLSFLLRVAPSAFKDANYVAI